MHFPRLLIAAPLLLLPVSALAQGTAAPIRLPQGSTGPADGLTVGGSPLPSRLLNPVPSGRRAVEQGQSDDLTVATRPGNPRSLLSRLLDLPWTIPDVGGVCDGSSITDTFWTALASDAKSISIPDGANCRIASSMTLPAGKSYRVDGSGRITVDAGKTVTIRGSFDAPLRRVFYGAGSVVGMREARPEWWGAGNTYDAGATRDDAPAFNAAIAAVSASVAPDGTTSNGQRPTVRFGGYYYACSPIDLYPSQTINLGFYGSGSLNGGGTISTCATFTGAALLNIHGISKAGGAYTGFDIDFRDFQLANRAGSGAQIGMSWVPEGAGYSLIGGLQPAVVENVAVTGFPTGIKYQNTRLVKFDRVSVWGSNKNTTRGLWITSSDNQSFTGDTEFVNFNTALCGSSTDNALCSGITNIRIDADGAIGAGSQNSERVKGIRFLLGLANAEKAIDIVARNGAFIGDLWVQAGTQIDGAACNTITLAAGNDSGNSSVAVIDAFHMLSTYNRGRNAGCTAVTAQATEVSKVRSLFITGNWFANTYKVGNFFNVQGLHFDGNTVYDPNDAVVDAAVSLSATSDFTANGNILTRSNSSSFVNLINLSAGSDYGTAVNNVCNGVTVSCVANNTGSANVIAPASANISSAH